MVTFKSPSILFYFQLKLLNYGRKLRKQEAQDFQVASIPTIVESNKLKIFQVASLLTIVDESLSLEV
jgi:hypothetical protein